MKRLLGVVALVVASFLFSLLLLELGVRLFVPAGYWTYRDLTFDWKVDPETGWVNAPDRDMTSRLLLGPVRYRTNPDGLIPAEARREKQPGVRRIMVFGDSMVVGRDLPQSDNYPARLQELLRERGIQAEVINAGVLGYSTDQALLLMERLLPLYQPEYVIFGSTSNDFGGNGTRSASGQSKPMFHLDASGRLDLTPPDPATEIRRFTTGPRAWVQYSALYRAIQPRLFRMRANLGAWQQRLVLGVVDDLYVNPSSLERVDWKLFIALVARMQEVSRVNGAQFLLIAHPEVGEVWEPYIERICQQHQWPRKSYDPFAIEKRIRALSDRAMVPYLPLIARFAGHPERGPFHLLPFDGHFSAAGNQFLAEQLADYLAQRLAPAPVQSLRQNTPEPSIGWIASAIPNFSR